MYNHVVEIILCKTERLYFSIYFKNLIIFCNFIFCSCSLETSTTSAWQGKAKQAYDFFQSSCHSH